MSIAPPILEQYEAFNSGQAAFVDEQSSSIQLTGKDRARFLHNFCTADVVKLAAGELAEAFVLDPKGKTLFFIQILAGSEELNLLIPVAQVAALSQHLDKYIIVEDVNLEVRKDVRIVYAKHEVDSFFPTHIADSVKVGLLSSEEVGEWQAKNSMQAIESEAFEMVRVENRFPISGQDVLDDCLAQEFERDATAISYTKGCYLGQETVARLDALGHTNRSFRLAKTDSSSKPDVSADLSHDGKACGRATSLAWSPKHNAFVALVMVRKPFHEAGQDLMLGDVKLTVIG